MAYLIAAALALFVCFASAQIGSAFPMSGGTYVAVSSVVSPFWGFMVVWMGVLIIFTSTSALAYGLVDYLAAYFPGLGRHRSGAVPSIVLFTGVNLLGIRTAVWAQTAMVVVFMAVLVGRGRWRPAQPPENFRPLFPVGVGPVLQAAIPAFYSFSGFSAIVALGGEVETRGATSRSCWSSASPPILAAYTLVTLAVPGVVPWRELAAGDATLTRVARRSCRRASGLRGRGRGVRDRHHHQRPRALQEPRRLLAGRGPRAAGAAGRDRAVRRAAQRPLLHVRRSRSRGCLMRRSFTEYASMSVLCVMVVHVLQGVVVLVLPRRPRALRGGRVPPGRAGRIFWGVGLIVVACGFILAGLARDRVGAVVYLVSCALGALWYLRRRAAAAPRRSASRS